MSQASERVLITDEPVIVKTKRLMAAAEDVISLAQGYVPLVRKLYDNSITVDFKCLLSLEGK